MKKTARLVLAIVFVLGIMIASSPLNAMAKSDELKTSTPNPLIASGSWTGGSSMDVSTLASSAPTWLQLLTDGVKVTEAGKICHPFRGGQFGWVGQIMQYKDGQWVKVTTVNDWVPNKEGDFMSCAQAPAAGTYALFGYWKRPAGYVESTGFDCNTLDWTGVAVSPDTFLYFSGKISSMPNTSIRIDYLSYSNTVTTGSDGAYYWASGIPVGSLSSIEVTYTELAHNCVYTTTHIVD